jgi:peptidoglycan/xylan/chitin deacetylase (PgdA/CDA1 family)
MTDNDRTHTFQLSSWDIFLRKLYFLFKPLTPRKAQILIRRSYLSRKKLFYRDIWPIDDKGKVPPPGWNGWPDGKQFALILTHDVETEKGREECFQLADVEESFGFRSCFNFTAKQYEVSADCLSEIKKKGFEVGLHGLYHDGNPFRSRGSFQKDVLEINRYLKEWDAVGFRTPSMYHNLEMISEMNIEYDSSTFDTDPFEPQPDGAGTIFPFWVQSGSSTRGFVELPYTLPQDFTLFVLFKERNIDIWKTKVDWIAKNGGMALLITHPDYLESDRGRSGMEGYPVKYYKDFLGYIKSKYAGQYWHVLPRDMARFWRKKMAIPQQRKSTE